MQLLSIKFLSMIKQVTEKICINALFKMRHRLYDHIEIDKIYL